MYLLKRLKNNYIKIILLLTLLLGAYLRFSGIYPGYPPYHSDEGMGYAQAAAIIKEGRLDAKNGYPLWLSYPSIVPYVNAIFYKTLFVPFYWSIYLFENSDKLINGQIKIPFTKSQHDSILQKLYNFADGSIVINPLHKILLEAIPK